MWITKAFGARVPVVSAPMAGASGGRLAHAVSAAGGLGMIGVGSSSTPEWIQEQAAIAGADSTPYGIGLMAWSLAEEPEKLDAVVELEPSLVSVSFGDFAPAIRRLSEAGVMTATQVGDLDDLDRALECGVDVIVARGGEGGGHGRDRYATLTLLQLVLERTSAPVLAAGGILNRRGLAAAMAAGAAGAWVGTAFLACPEAENTPAARRGLIQADRTAYGRVFDVTQQVPWPEEYGGRAVANEFLAAWTGREDQIDAGARQQHREAVEAQDYAVAHLYAGQGVADLDEELPAARVVEEFSRAVNGWDAVH